MKKILFVAFAATLLAAGCQKTEIINQVPGDAMTFSTGMSKLTKSSGDAADADNDGMTNLKAQDFRVWASYVEADPQTGAAANAFYDGMANSPVTYELKDSKDTWNTDKQYYWPGTGKKLNFFAVSGVDNAAVDAATKTLTVSNFTVQHDNAQGGPNTDLMVADFVQQDQNGSADKSVALNFRHVLSKVEFWFATGTQDTKVWVQQISVDQVNTKSTLTTTVAEANGVFTTTSTWGDVSDPQKFYDDYESEDGDNTDLPVVAADGVDPTEENLVAHPNAELNETENNMRLTSAAKCFTTWLVMPQDVKTVAADGVDLKVRVVYIMGNRQFVSEFPLGGTSAEVPAWGKNQYIKYTITLTPNLISFNPSVEDWTQDGAEGDSETSKDVSQNN